MDNLTELKLTGGKDCQDVLTGDNGGADVSVKFMSIVHSDDAVFTLSLIHI